MRAQLLADIETLHDAGLCVEGELMRTARVHSYYSRHDHDTDYAAMSMTGFIWIGLIALSWSGIYGIVRLVAWICG